MHQITPRDGTEPRVLYVHKKCTQIHKNVILTPHPSGSCPFLAMRALPGRPRAIERSSRPEGGLEVLSGPKKDRIPRAKV